MKISYLLLITTFLVSTGNAKVSIFESTLKDNFGMNYGALKKEAAGILKKKEKYDFKMSEEQALSIYAYTLGLSSKVNSALRKGDKNEIEKNAVLTDTLVSALKLLPDYKGPAKRGTKLPEEVLKTYEVGKTVKDPAFLGASLAGHYSGPHQMTITSKTGKIISPFSAHPLEVEVLFAPNTVFKVTKVSTGPEGNMQFNLEEQ